MSALRRNSNPDHHTTIISGRLLEVDWGDGTAQLHSPLRTVRLQFAPEQDEEMRRFANRYVEVGGVEVEGDVRQPRVVRVQALRETFSDDAFAHPRTVAELAEEQGVAPLTFNEAPSGTMNDEELDEFLIAIFGDRYQPVR